MRHDYSVAYKTMEEGKKCLLNALASYSAPAREAYNFQLEKKFNKDAEHPITIINPVLDDPAFWTMHYGTTCNNDKDALEHATPLLNETEKMLTLHYFQNYNNYECTGCGHNWQVYALDSVDYNPWVCPLCGGLPKQRVVKKLRNPKSKWYTFWKPIDGIQVHVPDPSIKEVYVVTYERGE